MLPKIERKDGTTIVYAENYIGKLSIEDKVQILTESNYVLAELVKLLTETIKRRTRMFFMVNVVTLLSFFTTVLLVRVVNCV